MRSLICLYILFLTILKGHASLISEEIKGDQLKKNLTLFSGRVTKINSNISLLRVKIEFKNSKFLSKDDRVLFWSSEREKNKCEGKIIGKSIEYLIIKVREIDRCLKDAQIVVGLFINLESKDLHYKIEVAKDVVSTLVKKKSALKGRLANFITENETYLNKVDVVRQRYEVLRLKMEREMQEELSNLESDRITCEHNIETVKNELMDIEKKLEVYSYDKQNRDLDRWALDGRLFIVK